MNCFKEQVENWFRDRLTIAGVLLSGVKIIEMKIIEL